jgi:hypothetical protein
VAAGYEEVLQRELGDATAVANTTTETLLVPAYTFPARFLYTPNFRTLRATVWGRWSNTGTPTITFRLRIGTATGGVAVCASSAYTTVTGVTNSAFRIQIDAQVRSGGSAGTMFGMGNFQFADAAAPTGGAEFPQFMPHATPAVSSAINMDTTQDWSLTATWSAASASNTIQSHLYTLEALM